MNIIIVEDEIRIREGLTKLICKIDSSYKVIGEATNGVEGLKLIEQYQPDVVITDIKMPDMDGLHMLRQVRTVNSKIKAIVLSAYSDFDYAKEAIKLGVSEYLLKPISINEVSQTLKNIEIQIKEEQKRDNSNLDELMTLEHVFYGILYSGLEVSEELCSFLKYNYNLDADKNFILIPVYLGIEYEEKYKKMIRLLTNVLEEKKFSSYVILPLSQNNSLLLVLYSSEELNQTERWFQNRVVAQIDRDNSYKACFGWIEFKGLLEMKKSLFILQKNMDWNIILGNGVMVSYPKVTQIQTAPLSYPIDIEKSMREALCALNPKLINITMLHFIRYFKTGAVYFPREIKETVIRFLWSMISVAKEIDFVAFRKIEQQKLLEEIMSAVTFEELEGILKRFLILDMSEIEDKNFSIYVQRMKSMVHEFYGQGITLDEIADKLQRTPEYLGTQFHKEVGVTYSIYLRDYRIQRAKELLIGTRLKSYEVAKQVGYCDPKYFAKVFRIVTGDLPGEFRKKYK